MATITKEIIQTTWGIHPARCMDFQQLYKGIITHVEKGNISRVTDKNLEIFNYTNYAQYHEIWDIFTLISRGLIVDTKQQKVIATPFPKFFNYGEAKIWNADKEHGEIVFFDKYDGSLGIVFFDGVKWRVATRGCFFSEQAIWGQKWFETNINSDYLKVGNTYLFEIVYLGNRVVVPYKIEGMILLSAYHESGWEYKYQDIEYLAKIINTKVAQVYRYEFIDLLVKAAKNLTINNEGWVVRFPNGHRLKIKGDEYCRIHRVITRVTPLAIWEMLLEGDNLEAVKTDLPEEYLQDFTQIESILKSKFETLIKLISQMHEKRKNISDKDAGIALQKGIWSDGSIVNDLERKFLFPVRKHEFFELVRDRKHRFRRIAFETFRPKQNNLEGFVASSSANRF